MGSGVAHATEPKTSGRGRALAILAFAYLFFLSIEFVGRGMKTSFKEPIHDFLSENAAQFTELVSFVMGILGTALVQSSSTVTSMCVVLTQEGIMPLAIAAGVVHGANLGTSVTSSIVAFATEVRPSTGNWFKDLRAMLFEPRGKGFQRAVGTAVVHDMFNIIMVTAILLLLELPFGFVLTAAEASADVIAQATSGGAGILGALKWLSPSTYTAPVSKGLIQVGVPGSVIALVGFPLLFFSLKGFSTRMKDAVLADTDEEDVKAMGQKLLGRAPVDTFVRGLVLTILVQSSSATTSMVVPLAAMGFFRVRAIFPFILGANIGTTTTALLAATGAVGQPGFDEGLTIALCHLYLNVMAVFFAVAVPGVATSVRGAAYWLAEAAAKAPWVLLAYLGVLAIVFPAIVYTMPQWVAAVFMGGVMLWLLVGPHVYVHRRATAQVAALASEAGKPELAMDDWD